MGFQRIQLFLNIWNFGIAIREIDHRSLCHLQGVFKKQESQLFTILTIYIFVLRVYFQKHIYLIKTNEFTYTSVRSFQNSY